MNISKGSVNVGYPYGKRKKNKKQRGEEEKSEKRR